MCNKKIGIKLISILLILVTFSILSSYSTVYSFPFSNDKGCKVLILSSKGKDDKVSDEQMINQALDKGGYIVIDVPSARKIDKEFDKKYAAFGSDDKFLVIPAILNFIGGQGWTLIQVSLGEYIFVKQR